MSVEIRFEVLPKEVADLAIELSSLNEADVRIEARDLRPPSADSTHGAYHLGTSELAVILLTLSSLAASVSALAAVIISYCNARRKEQNANRSFTLILDGESQIEVGEHTTVAELASLLSAKPVLRIRFAQGKASFNDHSEDAPPISSVNESRGRPYPHNRGRVFISYAHADNDSANPSHRWLDRLQKHLAPLVSQDQISIWSDKDLDIGDDWHVLIGSQLKGASAAILLVSPSFLSSHYIRNSELPVLLKRAVDDGLVVLPVIVRPCLFSEVRFKYPDPLQGPSVFRLSTLQSANPPSRSLVEMEEGEQDRVLLAVAKRVLSLIDRLSDDGQMIARKGD